MLRVLTNQHSSLNLSGCLTLPCSFNNWFNLQSLSHRLGEGRRNRREQWERQESERRHRNGVNKRQSERNRERRLSREGGYENMRVRRKQGAKRRMERMWAKLSMRLNWCVSCWSSFLKSFRHPTNSKHTHAHASYDFNVGAWMNNETTYTRLKETQTSNTVSFLFHISLL